MLLIVLRLRPILPASGSPYVRCPLPHKELVVLATKFLVELEVKPHTLQQHTRNPEKTAVELADQVGYARCTVVRRI